MDLLKKPLIIAGPCSAESMEQVMDTAVRLVGTADVFRAGLWKPRTRPGSFEGVGAAGLSWLQRVKRETGMPVATEVANRAHLIAAVEAGVDLVWLGARTTTSPFAVQEIADTLAELKPDVSVLVKNPMSPDTALWAGAIERLRLAGVKSIGAVLRGFGSYGGSAYRNHPHWRIPFELRAIYPELPLICDPSHIGGRRKLIEPLIRQAMQLRFDGLIVETHCNPDSALSDSAQQITPEQLADILESLKFNSATMDDSGAALETLRAEIDALDDELVNLLARRMDVAVRIAAYKKENGLTVMQPQRFNRLLENRMRQGLQLGLDPAFMKRLFSNIHEESVRRQLENQH